jgi:hypothetical protein
MEAFRFTLSLLISPRLWVPLNLVAGLYLSLGYPFSPHIPLHWIITGSIGIAALSFAGTSLAVYSVTDVRAFASDIMFDVMWLLVVVATASVVVTMAIVSNWTLQGVAFIGVAGVLALSDLAVSLYGGASKLLEMDKIRTSALPGRD